MLVCENLNLNLAKPLFKNLSFIAYPGEILMVVGKNGTGKSTLLKTLTGQMSAQFSELSFRGAELSRLSSREKAKLFAYVVQDNERGTLGELSVIENLCFALGKNKRFSFLKAAVSKEKEKSIKIFLERYSPELLSRLSQVVSSLSGGQRQMLSVLMNLLSEAPIFLLDEPTAALDDLASDAIMVQVKKCVIERKLTAIMVCHDAELVRRYGDRILTLENPLKI